MTHSLELDRIGAAARWVGISQEALDYAMDYARNRIQFGRKISSFEWTRNLFAEMQTRVDAARLLTSRAARRESATLSGAISSAPELRSHHPISGSPCRCPD